MGLARDIVVPLNLPLHTILKRESQVCPCSLYWMRQTHTIWQHKVMTGFSATARSLWQIFLEHPICKSIGRTSPDTIANEEVRKAERQIEENCTPALHTTSPLSRRRLNNVRKPARLIAASPMSLSESLLFERWDQQASLVTYPESICPPVLSQMFTTCYELQAAHYFFCYSSP